MCNMAVEAGAKNGIIGPDDITRDYLQGRVKHAYSVFTSDADAEYETVTWDASQIRPMVAQPHSPANVIPGQRDQAC